MSPPPSEMIVHAPASIFPMSDSKYVACGDYDSLFDGVKSCPQVCGCFGNFHKLRLVVRIRIRSGLDHCAQQVTSYVMHISIEDTQQLFFPYLVQSYPLVQQFSSNAATFPLQNEANHSPGLSLLVLIKKALMRTSRSLRRTEKRAYPSIVLYTDFKHGVMHLRSYL